MRTLIWIAVTAVFLLGVMGSAYALLDNKKADKESIAQIQADVREIRNFLMGHTPRGYP